MRNEERGVEEFWILDFGFRIVLLPQPLQPPQPLELLFFPSLLAPRSSPLLFKPTIASFCCCQLYRNGLHFPDLLAVLADGTV
ncbi:MAG: hypothetical protein N4J56_000454 [Chroococcidiopsis sp. SAG 2025]|nr:hypothetical protein [Chroococcidiopsis sp. SAG 2025]